MAFTELGQLDPAVTSNALALWNDIIDSRSTVYLAAKELVAGQKLLYPLYTF